MKILSIAFSLLLTATSLTGMAGEAAPATLQETTRVNRLGTDLLASRLRNGGIGNAMVSPVSLFFALGILELGAAGDSATLLRSVLLDDQDASLRDVAPGLAGILEHANDGDGGETGTFQLSNSIWSTTGATNRRPFVFSDHFVAAAESVYGASHQALDFMAPGASDHLNSWAEQETNGLIPEIIDDELLSELEWAIMNAVYFEGGWATPMRAIDRNEQYRFRHLDGTAQQAETIVTKDYRARVLDLEDGSVAFQLPFLGNKYTFIVHAPADDEEDVETWLLGRAVPDLADTVSRVLDNRSTIYQLTAQLPVFSFSSSITMRDGSPVVRDLGIELLFTDKADFLPMVDTGKTTGINRHTKVGIIKQDTRIELDENGVKAAAVTLIGGIIKSTTIAPRLPERRVIVDRPFAFAIIENASRAILFNGVLVSPEP